MCNIRGDYQFKVSFKKWFLAGANNTDSIIEGCKTLVDNICSKRSLQHSTLLYYRDAVDSSGGTHSALPSLCMCAEG